MAKGATVSELVDRLVQRHGASPERAEADVNAFIADLEARDLIEREPGAEAL